MRAYLMTLATLLVAGPVAASSIESLVTPVIPNHSITTLDCAACPPLADSRKITYVVPQIAPGTERSEILDRGGRMTIVRTESWFGGSPVVFVSKASDAAIRAAIARQAEPEFRSAQASALPARPVSATAKTTALFGVDTQMTTAALGASPAPEHTAPTGASLASRNFYGDSFQLRLD